MIKFILYEDSTKDMDLMIKAVCKMSQLREVDYRIYKYEKYDDSINEIIADENDKKIFILDVEVPEVSGLEIASRVREDDWKSVIIFVTAHRQYKDDVIYSRLVALDFIQKQLFCQSRLEETLNVALKILETEKYFVFRSHHIDYQLAYDEIMYIEKIPFTKKCQIVTDDGMKIDISKPLHEMANLLDKRFYQTHKSCLVNVNKIKKISTSENKITFTNGKYIYLLSNRRQKGLKEHVKLFK